MEGLTSVEARKRLKKEGKNLIPRRKISLIYLFLRQFQSWFIFLLFGSALISLILGEIHQVITIFLIVGITGFLGFLQEFRHQKIIEKLENLISYRVWVKRDGQIQEIKKEDLVSDDLVILEKGDIIPADLKLLSSQGFLVDEAILTGESKPVEKNKGDILFAGTEVLSGSGEGIVIKKGGQTRISQIAWLASGNEVPSVLEEDIKVLSRFIMKLVVITLFLVFLGNILFKGFGTDIPAFLLFISALGVGIVPEALPAVVLVTLSFGAAKMAKKGAIVKRLSSLDDFGNIKILCVDKTGTLTQDTLEVSRIWAKDEKLFWRLFLASTVGEKDRKGKLRNHFDEALLKTVKGTIKEENWHLVLRIPFDASKRREAVVVKKGREILMIIKGAPEEILRLSILSPKERENFELKIREEGKAGKRVYALAFKRIKGRRDFQEEEERNDFSFVGFVSFVDSLKPGVKKILDRARKLGLDVRILTGDTPELALMVGRKISLIEKDERVISGFDLERLSKKEAEEAIFSSKIFARVTPEQKLRIVNILRKKFSVGFLGDGINDAPALKAATVGIAVDRASDVAKEAADVVLLEKDLGLIIDGIEEGRKTFLNVIKYIRYTLSSNFGNCYALAIISLFIPFLPLMPNQVLLVNLLSDFPLIGVALDNVDEQEIKSPQSLNLNKTAILIIILGIVSSFFDFVFFFFYRNSGERIIQTLWFIESVLTEIVFIYSIRTRFFFLKAKSPAKIFLVFSFLTFITTLIIPFSPFAESFYFERPLFIQLLGVFLIVLFYFLATEAVKISYFKFHKD
jgi:Mg2+-importing ATPase